MWLTVFTSPREMGCWVAEAEPAGKPWGPAESLGTQVLSRGEPLGPPPGGASMRAPCKETPSSDEELSNQFSVSHLQSSSDSPFLQDDFHI